MRILRKSNPSIALFGGAFNPPHRGHVAMVRALLRQRDIDAVWILPVYRHPFAKELLSFSLRYQMCRLAFSALSPRVKISRIEERLGSPSYMVKTLQALVKRYPRSRFCLVMGADSYRARDRWKNFDRIRALADLVVFPRGPRSRIPRISSTQIRQQAREGRSVRLFVPPRVATLIKKRGLYGMKK